MNSADNVSKVKDGNSQLPSAASLAPVPTKTKLGAYLFTFVIIGDTHMNEVEQVCSSSPFKSNLLSNGRTRYAIHEINRIKPVFTIHLGDLIHPVPELPTYGSAAEYFLQTFKKLQNDIYLTPGNHDIGDKPMPWTPATIVSSDSLKQWENYFGRHYYSFNFGDCHFVVINSEIINTDLDDEKQQQRWLEKDLSENAHLRTFINMHYPPYVTYRYETENYDNIAEPGRSWLLSIIEKYKPEALFAGHVHNFWYNRYSETDCYILPSTSFVRQDYSELFKVEPMEDFGRDDPYKVGYTAVKIYERGHVCHFIRTLGKVSDIEKPELPNKEFVPSIHAKENMIPSVGIDLRHPWAEIVEITPNGALDEFERKKVRNDYPLMAIWEMGIQKLRIPIQDLEDSVIRERIRILRSFGHKFTVYTFGIPKSSSKDALITYHDLVDAWEVVSFGDSIDNIIKNLKTIKSSVSLKIYLSKLRLKDELSRDGDRYYHLINHGFTVTEMDELYRILKIKDAAKVINGFVFRADLKDRPWDAFQSAKKLVLNFEKNAVLQIRMGPNNPAKCYSDDSAIACRVAETIFVAATNSETDVFLNTFADIDRGHSPRNGLVDRRYNPRLSSYIFQNFYGILNNFKIKRMRLIDTQDLKNGRILRAMTPNTILALVLPEKSMSLRMFSIEEKRKRFKGDATITNLHTGEITNMGFEQIDSQGEMFHQLKSSVKCVKPTLIIME